MPVKVGVKHAAKGATDMFQRVLAFERRRVRTSRFEFAAVSALCLLAFLLRLSVALKMSWLYDEIVYVQWLGDWFAAHGLAYVFQLQHTIYPPSSPYFANPPFPTLLYGLAIWLLHPAGVPDLLAARFVNVVFGTALVVLVYRVASIWLGAAGRITAAFFAAAFPVLVALGGSSYQETIAAFFGIWAISMFARCATGEQKRWIVYALPVVLALALLSKLTNLYVYAGLTAASVYLATRRVMPWRIALATAIGAPLVCAILWAGARDPHHIAGVIHYVTAARPADNLAPVYPSAEKPVYYVLMMFGTMPLAVSLLVAFGVVFFTVDAAIRRRITPAFAWIAATLAVLATLPYLVGMSTRHEIALPACAMAIVAGFCADRFRLAFAQRPFLTGAGAAVLALSTAAAYLMPIGLLNTYNNRLVGGISSVSLYSSGDGAGLDTVGKWLDTHTRSGAEISSTASYALAQYLTAGRTIRPAFTNSSAAAFEGTSWLVVPLPYLADKQTVLAKTAQGYAVAGRLPSDRYPLYVIYRVKNARYVLHSARTFTAETFRAQPPYARTTLPLAYRGSVSDGGYVSFNSALHPVEGNAIAVTYRKNRGTIIYVDVTDPSGARYMRGAVAPSAPDSGTSIVPYERMTGFSEHGPGSVTIDALRSGAVRLRLSADAQGLKSRTDDVQILRAGSVLVVPEGSAKALDLNPRRFYISGASRKAGVTLHKDFRTLGVRLNLPLSEYATISESTSLHNFSDVALAFRAPLDTQLALYVDEMGSTRSGKTVMERQYVLTSRTGGESRLYLSFPRSKEPLTAVSLRLGFGTHASPVHDAFFLDKLQLID